MEPGPSGSSGSGGSCTGGGISSMPERAVQQLIVAPIPGPSTRPYLAQPVQMPAHFVVPPEQLLPHQVKSGIDIGNLFKLLNALQNRIALACGQHQYLRDPENQPRPPQDGGYKPLTPQAAVRDIRSLCKQQRNLMEKLRRWNCTNDGKCYDLVMQDTFNGICSNCEPFAASRIRMKRVSKTLRKQEAKARRRSLKKLTASAKIKQRLIARRKVAVTAPVPGPSSRVIPGPSSRILPGPSSRVLPGPSSRAFSVPSYYLLPGPSSRLLPPPPVFRVPTSPPVKKRRKKSYTPDPDPPHPETYLTQESFLSELGLVTPEVYLKAQAESRRTERRRRTTANPKYKSKDDPNDAGRSKRSRRSDPSSLEPPPPPNSLSLTGVERRKAKQKRYECTVCEKKDVTVTCTRCMSGFHPDCIRVTATHAPPPETVTVCPNCVPCNPHIRSSDCILVSRRMSRPSIMGLKSDVDELKPSRSPKHSQASRNYRATSRRRATARNYSKAARRNAAAKAKQQKQKTKAVVICKPTPVVAVRKAGGQSSKKCYAKRTLNHSLAVAAAAAVPAYCSTSTTSSVEDEDDEDDDDDESEEVEEAKDEMVEKEPVKARSSQPIQRKRKLVASTSATFTRVKQQQSTPASGEHKALFAKRENSTTAQQQTISKAAKESTFAKKSVVPMKSSNMVSKKLQSQSSIETEELNVGQRNVPSQVTQQPGEIKAAQQTLTVNHAKVDINRPKKTFGKVEKVEENASPTVSENDGQTPTTSKAVTAKKDNKVQQVKKVSVTKSPGQIGPFCMKRTMMAMSAAAGLVFSGSGLKLGNVQNNASPQSSLSNSPTPVSIPQKSIEQSQSSPKPVVASPAVPSTNTACTPVPVQSVSKAAMDAKLKYVAQKLTKSPMAAQLADIVNYNSKCANDIKKSSQTVMSPSSAAALEVPSKSLPKSMQALVSTPETTTNTANSFEKTEKLKTTETTAHNKPKTLVTFSASTSQTSQSNLNTKTTDNANKTSVNVKANPVQAQRLIPEPAAIVSQLANTIKNKLGEKGLNKISTVAAETLAKHVQCAIPSTSCSSSGLSASGSDDISITKFAVLPTETKGKTVKISPKSPTTFSHYASLKYDSDEETKRIQTTPPETKLNYINKKPPKKPAFIKSIKNAPSQTVPQQQKLQPPVEDHQPPKKQSKIIDTKEVKVVNRNNSSAKPTAKVKAKKAPKPVPKMDPAVEQSVNETIERVVYESGAGLYVDDEDEIDDAYSLAIAMRKKNPRQPRPRLTYDDDVLSKIVGNPYTKLLSKSCQLPDEIDFSYKKISHDHHHHHNHDRNERAGSPASNSSTIGSSRSLRDLDSDSSDLLSIPDTPIVPYLDLRRLELPSSRMGLSPLEKLEMRRKNLASGIHSKRGRGGGKGRGGRY